MTRPPAEHRIGQPAPLIFHMSAALAAYQNAVLAAPGAACEAFPWHPELERYAGPAPEPLAVAGDAARRLSAMVEGIRRWQGHPYRRAEAPRPVLWSAGSTRLVDYGGDGPPVLVVPSLINRAYILDLMPDHSFLTHLAGAGLRPLLLDWGAPGRDEARFDLVDYVDRRLAPALAAAQVLGGGRPPALLGYCMGGTLAVSWLRTRGAEARAVVTIGAPWAFEGGQGLAAEIRAVARQGGIPAARQAIRAMADAFGTVPVWFFQQLFAWVDPMQAARKFQRFARADMQAERSRLFVAIEDWLADGVPMAGPAAETLLVSWQLEDAVARGRWPGGVSGAQIACPALVIAGRRDTIAPPGMADPILEVLPQARHLTPPLGHVGMITGASAEVRVWRPVVEFLRQNA